ncbi:MAG TPA: alpha/beta hydrolase [Dermatophilaceae bacterium]|nr:alpha/beta hydrolase [Dermatophilaceae bacterium]
MPTVTNGSVQIHYEDTGGAGRAVVLVHGWPLSGESWADLAPALRDAGYRVVAYDRRGFGRSGKPGAASPYDYDTLTGDLDALMRELDLRDATLVGFSMGGGEVARYVGTHGADRVRSVVFASAIPPCLLQDENHPDGGLPMEMVRSLQEGLRADPPGFLDGFLHNFYSVDGELKVTEAQLQAAIGLAGQADVHAAAECIESWASDFTGDVARIAELGLPTLVIHGDSDATVPFEVSGKRTHEAVPGSELVLLTGGPHGIPASHTEEFNAAVLALLRR